MPMIMRKCPTGVHDHAEMSMESRNLEVRVISAPACARCETRTAVLGWAARHMPLLAAGTPWNTPTHRWRANTPTRAARSLVGLLVHLIR